MLIVGDCHITDKRPESRIDNFEETVFTKLSFIFQTAKQYNCIVLQPGDFFDVPSPSYKLFTQVVKLLNRYNMIKLYVIMGQHDLRFRNAENIALKALEQSCTNFTIVNNSVLIDNICLYGSSYNEDVPKVLNKNAFNILLTHRMILKEKIWEAQTDYADAANFLRSNSFQLIVSGDNHQSFWVDSKVQKKCLFNNGALLRNKTDMIDHKPYVILFDTETQDWKQIFIPIEPAEKVFNLVKIEKEKEKDKNLEAFVLGLSANKETGLTFEDNLNAYMNELKIEGVIRNIIEEAKRT